MSEQAWFKLLIRAIGVFLVATAIPELISSILQTIAMARWQGAASGVSPDWQWTYYAYVGASMIKMGIGFYLLMGGAWLFRRCMRDLDGHCFSCGYPLGKVTGETCPECGTRFRAAPTPPSSTQAAHLPDANPA